MRSIFALAAVALVLGGCARITSGEVSVPTPTPSPSTGPGPGFDVMVTENDHSVSLRVGQKLLVVLHAGANMTRWSQPNSSDTTVLAPVVDPALTAPVGVTLGAFQARAPGQVSVTAIAGPKCEAGQACPMYAILYSLQVTITA